MSSASLPARPRPGRRAWARTADVAIAVVALTLTAPVLALAALAVRLGSTGPVLERRVTRYADGRRIELLSLRTLVDGGASRSHARIVAVTGGGTPVTGVGRVLRATRLHRLPRLVNVLRGEATLFRARD